MSADAQRWSCARCDVSVGRMDGGATKLPGSWSRADGGVFCLSCSRARAGDAAFEAASASSSREDRIRLRRKALIEFEIDRLPEAPNRTIALACHTSSATVAAVRAKLPPSTAATPEAGAGSAA